MIENTRRALGKHYCTILPLTQHARRCVPPLIYHCFTSLPIPTAVTFTKPCCCHPSHSPLPCPPLGTSCCRTRCRHDRRAFREEIALLPTVLSSSLVIPILSRHVVLLSSKTVGCCPCPAPSLVCHFRYHYYNHCYYRCYYYY